MIMTVFDEPWSHRFNCVENIRGSPQQLSDLRLCQSVKCIDRGYANILY